jgi:bifunctional ADP-heptose synthase (sugar kinase/adenylyltransferase)
MRVLVLGDRIQDFYVFGRVECLCPEAPVPVFTAERNEVREGGAALVAANLEALGAEVIERYGSYSEKTRFFAGNHLLLRVDDDASAIDQFSIQNGKPNENPAANFSTTKIIKAIKQSSSDLPFNEVDAVVISDYGKGAIHPKQMRDLLREGSQVPVFVDAKYNPDYYTGCFASFPNARERAVIGSEHVIQKLGERGCSVDGVHVPAKPRKVYDVTGAGDVFLAAFVYRYLGTKDLMLAAQFANECAGASVEHLGTHVLEESEIPVCS